MHRVCRCNRQLPEFAGLYGIWLSGKEPAGMRLVGRVPPGSVPAGSVLSGIERLAAGRLQRMDTDQLAFGVVVFGIIPFGVDRAVLDLARAFGTNGGAQDVSLRLLGPSRLRIVIEGRNLRGRAAGEQQDCSDDGPPHELISGL